MGSLSSESNRKVARSAGTSCLCMACNSPVTSHTQGVCCCNVHWRIGAERPRVGRVSPLGQCSVLVSSRHNEKYFISNPQLEKYPPHAFVCNGYVPPHQPCAGRGPNSTQKARRSSKQANLEAQAGCLGLSRHKTLSCRLRVRLQRWMPEKSAVPGHRW